MQADIFNNFASFNSTDSSTPLINESESKYFRNDNINNFDMINTGKFDKFENNILGENNTLDSITEKTQKQSDECKNKFGTKLIYSKLYEMIDRLSFVVSLNTLTLETHGSGAQRTREGDLILSSNVMAYLTGTDLMISTDR